MKKLLLAVCPLLIANLPAQFAHAEPGLQLITETCNDIDADELGQILAAEFQQANDGKSTISITCEGAFVRVKMLEAGTIRQHARLVDLSEVEAIARPRMLALLIGELLTIPPEVSAAALALPSPPPEPEPEPVAVPKPPDPEVEATTKTEARPSPTVLVDAGLALGRRSFRYAIPESTPNPPMVRAFDSSALPMARLQVQVFPFDKDSRWSGLGVNGSYAQAPTTVSRTADNQSLNSHWMEWEANARYQRGIKFGTIAGEVGIGRQRYDFTARAAEPDFGFLDEVPGVDYRYARVAVNAIVDLSDRIEASLDLEYRSVSEVGALVDQIALTKVTAWGAGASLDYRLNRMLRARLNYSRETYEHEIILDDFGFGFGETASASDEFRALTIGLRYQHY
jgi:hypothetical protein